MRSFSVIHRIVALSAVVGLCLAARGQALAVQEQDPPLMERRGLASWFGAGERLKPRTAMGRRVNPRALEAAMWDVPFGTRVRVTNLQNGRSIVVRITDRGPARRLTPRVIDLTRRAFSELAPLRQGLISVVVRQAPE